MNLIWLILIILFVFVSAALVVTLVLGILCLLVFSIVEYIEKRSTIIRIGGEEAKPKAQKKKLASSSSMST